MIAFRRALFTRLGGYRTFYFMNVEEGDLAVRLLDAGFLIKLGTAPPLDHHESPIRASKHLNELGPRNHILYAWYNVPLPHLVPHILGSGLKSMLYIARLGPPRSGGARLGQRLAGGVARVATAAPSLAPNLRTQPPIDAPEVDAFFRNRAAFGAVGARVSERVNERIAALDRRADRRARALRGRARAAPARRVGTALHRVLERRCSAIAPRTRPAARPGGSPSS